MDACHFACAPRFRLRHTVALRIEMIVRNAHPEDVSACVELVEARRRRYETFEPRFWKKAANSKDSSKSWFSHLFSDSGTVSIVAAKDPHILGFLIGCEIQVPPVYEPGGRTVLVDDFCVAEGQWADVGASLLAAAKQEFHERGFVQLVVVGARLDLEKSAFLETTDLSLASTWWTGPT